MNHGDDAIVDVESRSFLLDMLVGLRRTHGLTQTEVAERMGVTQPTISDLETQTGDPRLSTVQRYARAVGAELILELRLCEPEQCSHDRA